VNVQVPETGNQILGCALDETPQEQFARPEISSEGSSNKSKNATTHEKSCSVYQSSVPVSVFGNHVVEAQHLLPGRRFNLKTLAYAAGRDFQHIISEMPTKFSNV
jgi:hypothetical protein